MPDNRIDLYGSVGESFWGEEHFTARQVADRLAGVAGPVTVRINSGGGIASEGQAIYSLLRDHPAEVHVVIDGIAASAASLIAMAGDTIAMRDGALMMIHDPAQPWTQGRGTEADHLAEAAKLRVQSNAYARVYAGRAGVSVDRAREIMRAETYYDGPGAVAAGFADVTSDDAAVAMAPFDYRIYAHAPARLLRNAGGALAPRKRAAVLAAVLGLGPQSKGRMQMDRQRNVASKDDEDDETMTVPPETDEDEDDEEDDEETGTGRATAILDLCIAAGRDARDARRMIRDGLSVAEARAMIARKQERESPMKGKPLRGSAARIIRDEGDTMRDGMEGALVAKMAQAREVKGPAREYMSYGTAEMAALHAGIRLPRNAAERERVLRDAMGGRRPAMAGIHTTSDFGGIYENSLNKRLEQQLQASPPKYTALAKRMDFNDFRPHPVVSVGSLPALQPVPEAGEIKFGTFSDKAEMAVLLALAIAATVSRQMVVNDDMGAIDRVIGSAAATTRATFDALFFGMMTSGTGGNGPTLQETGRQVFNTTDGTLAGTPAAITVPAVGLGRAHLRKLRSLDGLLLDANGRKLVTGADKETEAEQFLAEIQPTEVEGVNPFSGRLELVVTPHISGNAWYLMADPATNPCFMYGFLEGQEGPRIRIDEPFGRQGMSFSVEADFGCAAIDWRGVYRNAGA